MDDEMTRFGLDVLTADRLLCGDIASADAPPGYQLIADIIQRASDPGPDGESRRERATVAAMAQTLRAAPPAPRHDPRRRKVARTRANVARAGRVKVAALAATFVLGATAAGAATDILPGPVQRAVSDAASHLGLSLPKPVGHTPGARSAPTNALSGEAPAQAGRPLDPAARHGRTSTVQAEPPPHTDKTVGRGSNAKVPPVSAQQPAGPPVSTPLPPVVTPQQPSGPPVTTEPPSGPPVSTPQPTEPSDGCPANPPGQARRKAIGNGPMQRGRCGQAPATTPRAPRSVRGAVRA